MWRPMSYLTPENHKVLRKHEVEGAADEAGEAGGSWRILRTCMQW